MSVENFDIQVNIKVLAKNEAEAEHAVLTYLRTAGKVIDAPDIIDYELLNFVPADLKNSCCC